ncbi:MAG: hypothetical protein ACXADL_16425, partial [Candidatus Thorarchaeota archaeon]
GKAAKRAIAQRVSGDFLSLRDDEEVEDVLDFLPNIEEPVIEAEDVIESEEAAVTSDVDESEE